jgi:multiple sugar transport system substrate-binding protein
VQALELLRELGTNGTASRSLSNSQEPEVFAQMQTGEAAFILNWPYVSSAMAAAAESDEQSAEVLDNLAATSIPQATEDQPARVTLGGRNIGVSSTSEHKAEAFEAALCMASPESQVTQAIEAGDVPVTEELFERPEIREAFPQYEIILESLQTASNRPKSPVYQNISTTISNVISPPSQIEPEETAERLRSEIQDALDGKGILP